MRQAGRTIPQSQHDTLELALTLAGGGAGAAYHGAIATRLERQSPDWKLDYQNLARMTPEEIARRRAEFDQQKTVAKTVRDGVAIAPSSS